MKRFSIIIFVLILLSVPVFSYAEGVIGLDKEFSIKPVQFLIANTTEEKPYVAVFNYFFTIEVFVGLFGLWMRLLFRVFRM